MITRIEAYDNGAHANQSVTPKIIPEGWAAVPDDMEVPETFPFVSITVDGQTVTGMTAGEVPPPQPEPAPSPAAQDDTDAMLLDHEYRIVLLELGITE